MRDLFFFLDPNVCSDDEVLFDCEKEMGATTKDDRFNLFMAEVQLLSSSLELLSRKSGLVFYVS